MNRLTECLCVSSALTKGNVPVTGRDDYENVLKIRHLPSWTTLSTKGFHLSVKLRSALFCVGGGVAELYKKTTL